MVMIDKMKKKMKKLMIVIIIRIIIRIKQEETKGQFESMTSRKHVHMS